MRHLVLCLLFLLKITPVQAIELGQGFLAAEDLWTPQCVSGDSFFSNNQLGVFEAEIRYMDSKAFFNQVFTTGAGLDLGIIGADGNVTVDQTLGQQDRSWYLVISYKINKATELLRQIRPNDFGKKAIKYSDSTQFKNFCGDHYLSEIQKGTKIHLVARYDFKQVIVGTTFKFKISVKIAGKKISKTITKSATLKNELENYSQYVIVEGGDSDQIKQGVQQLMSHCDPKDIDSCDQVVDHLVEYISSENFHELVTANNAKALNKKFKPYPANIFQFGGMQ